MLCRRLLQARPLARPLAFSGLHLRCAADAASGGAGSSKAPSTPGESSGAAQPGRFRGGRFSRAAQPGRAPSTPGEGGGAADQAPSTATVADQVDRHIKGLQGRSNQFRDKWRKDPGHAVPYRFRVQTPAERQGPPGQQRDQQKQDKQEADLPYSDYAGLRFPTLETAENFDYHKDRGMDRLVERAYPIKVPGYRRIDPYLREYIHFLHDLDPVRFTISRIAQRYRLREKTVAKVVQEWGVNRYLTRTGLTKLRDKQVTKEGEMLAKKEQQYAKWVGYDQLGDEDDPESDDEALGEFKGWRSTNDWIRRQNVEVEMMSAFPMMEKRNPMPKRVDIDLTVDSRQHHKVINWIDPTDKVVF